MHTPTNLALTPPAPWASACADRVQFLHVKQSRRDPSGLFGESLRMVLTSGRIDVPEEMRRDSKTIAAEKGLDLLPSVYLYAGRAYPARAGIAVCAVVLEDLLKSPGERLISPFDTGSLFHDKSKLRWMDFPPGSKLDYLRSHSATLREFQAYFCRFLTAYFTDAASYWVAPKKSIDNAALTAGDDWRDWTFEARVSVGASVASAKWYFNHEADSHYGHLLADGLVDEIPDSRYEVDSHPISKAEDDVKMFAAETS